MVKLTYFEQQFVEELLGMDTGYVSDFSDRTFRMFISDFGIDIDDEKYHINGTSKAKRLRALIELESNIQVSAILEALLEYQKAVDRKSGQNRDTLYSSVEKIILKLRDNSMNPSIVLPKNEEDFSLSLLGEEVRKSIEENNPLAGLDRLHTYMIRYSRKLCDKHSIQFQEKTNLNALFGSYVRHLKDLKKLESGMTIRILGSYIKILDEYNNTRNNESLAHDNKFINNHEALLILTSVMALVRFVDNLENNYE